MQALLPRQTVAQICGHRDRAIALYDQAYEAMESAFGLLSAAQHAVYTARNRENRFNQHQTNERRAFLKMLDLPPREEYLSTVRRMTDTDIWAHIIELTDLERLMDKKAKDDFTKQLRENPPEATLDTIFATLDQFRIDAGAIFRRGIANTFSSLDRRFRSHDGFKIGSRIILDYAFDGYGMWNYHRNQRDALQDVERVFFVLDEKPVPPVYSGIVGAIDAVRQFGRGPTQDVVESDFFTARLFKNGNLHLWFKRDDLVRKANKMLAEWYGEVVGDGNEAEEDVLKSFKMTPARNFGFFPTPPAAVKDLIYHASLSASDGRARRVLEPSAGTGNIARAAREKGADVHCVEVQPALAEQLRRDGFSTKCADFLLVPPDPSYDVVLMNPPFDRERDIDHVMHAWKFLSDTGQLHAIMSAGTEFRETKKARAFRDFVAKHNGRWDALPPGSFAESGTNVNTVIVRISKAKRSFW